MPVVRVEMWPGRTQEQKARLVKAITSSIADIIHAPPEATTVVIYEVPRENWAIGGALCSEQRA